MSEKPNIIALVAASDFNAQHFRANYSQFSKVIAVDGGYKHLDVVPDVAVGDFDSLGYVPDNCKVLQYPEDKDKTDLELAIEEALTYKPQVIMIYGILGRRLDHELSAIQMLSRISDYRVGVFAVGIEQSAVVLNGPAEFGLTANGEDKTFSVFSLSDVSAGIESKGLKWPYVNTALTSVMSLGISNEIVEPNVHIKVQQGKLLLIFSTQHLSFAL